jgi:hypothetical protein
MKLTLQKMTLNINIISIPYKNTSNEMYHTEHTIGRGNDNNQYNYSAITLKYKHQFHLNFFFISFLPLTIHEKPLLRTLPTIRKMYFLSNMNYYDK